MDVVIPPEHTESYETEAKAAVLKELEPLVKDMMDEHLRKRRLWFPSDFLPSDEQMDEDEHRLLGRLRERARGIADPVRVAVVLNLLTEEGLPHFHRLLSTYLGDESVWNRWNFMWTAEEDRHGCVLRDYARDARLFKWREVEMMQYAYQEAGFTPEWDRDPYRVFVYTTLQERATQLSHQNTGKLVGDDEPLLKGILSSVAADEAKHFSFYRKVFRAILEIDPNRALESALAIMPSIDMPGVSMPNFRDMADIVRRAGIYGPWDYKKIVEEAISFWKIEVMTGLNEAGRKAQEKILNIPKRLQKVAEYIERRTQMKSFRFDFIYGRELAMG
ncbi:acyl-ACP desaturase [Rhodocaloribacter litoris]|uniref:acyl-ACP desaturase n=1 Tax=Rhodocaloribacter litoris TaxID=2558931 RepID=UPI00141E3EF5|nr:acyl-ACP desaturase [Rhodocaloribacter litoris]QXD14850.1 acyl-ACP desaturase [Rhodocaloribacter litoris]